MLNRLSVACILQWIHFLTVFLHVIIIVIEHLYSTESSNYKKTNHILFSIPVLLKLWAAAWYRAGEVWLSGRGVTPEIYILYRAFRTIRKYNTVFILTLS